MEDKIEAIPATMEKFFGCAGQMVRPAPKTVKNLVKNINQGSVITLNQLRDRLAQDFGVEAACPASTTKALQILANEDEPISYWRVIKKNGELIAKFPNGVDGHAALLEKEGFQIDYSKKVPVVVDFKSRLGDITP